MNKTPPPDAAVLDFLARYPEAGDGFDPLGLADGELADAVPDPVERPSGRRP